MLLTKWVKTRVDLRNKEYYENLGYTVPTYTDRDKNLRVKRSTEILVKIEHLSRGSHEKIEYFCTGCESTKTAKYADYLKRKYSTCRACTSALHVGPSLFTGGSIWYWVRRLIRDADNPACEISGETDKRFLELHHKLPKSKGGENSRENLAILSANYHTAFHRECGGNSASKCTPEMYEAFKEREIAKLKILTLN